MENKQEINDILFSFLENNQDKSIDFKIMYLGMFISNYVNKMTEDLLEKDFTEKERLLNVLTAISESLKDKE